MKITWRGQGLEPKQVLVNKTAERFGFDPDSPGITRLKEPAYLRQYSLGQLVVVLTQVMDPDSESNHEMLSEDVHVIKRPYHEPGPSPLEIAQYHLGSNWAVDWGRILVGNKQLRFFSHEEDELAWFNAAGRQELWTAANRKLYFRVLPENAHQIILETTGFDVSVERIAWHSGMKDEERTPMVMERVGNDFVLFDMPPIL